MVLKSKVLLIHQDRNFRDAIAACLAESGYSVYTAMDRKDGFQSLYKAHPDVVLIDLSQSIDSSSAHEDGWETLQRIRLYTDIPVLLIVNQISEVDQRRAAASHATELVQAPFSPAKLAAKVEAIRQSVANREALAMRMVEPAGMEPLLSSSCLSQAQLRQLDRAIVDVGELGEVRLIKYRGRLRFLEKVKTERYPPFRA